MLLPPIFTAHINVVCIEVPVIKIHLTSTLSGGKGGGMKFEKKRNHRSTIYGQDCSYRKEVFNYLDLLFFFMKLLDTL